MNTGLWLFGALALGLAVAAVPARAQGWVDPPPRTATASPPAAEQGATASQRTSRPLPDPTKEASVAPAAGPPGASAPSARPAPTGTETAARAAPRPERPPPEPSAAAQQLAMEYLAFWSAPNAVTMTATPEFYAPLVIFHGRGMTARELFEEKLRFVRRWPERNYTPRLDTLRVSCDAATEICTVRTAFDFVASNPERGRRSQGTGNLELGVSFVGKRPLIVGETSRVTRRRIGATTSSEDPDD